jgi:hypothetical protein
MDELMGKTCSYFYPRGTNMVSNDSHVKKALFGGYPTQDQVYLLENMGVTWFVDLTLGNEKRTTPYIVTNKDKYITYPIVDQCVPSDIVGFVKFINKLVSIISSLMDNEKLYIHCKGGHGRSGLIVATLMCVMDEIGPERAIRDTTTSHNQRHMMKRKWKKIGSPQTRDQCRFLHSLFESQNIDHDIYLSPSSPHSVVLTYKIFQDTTEYDIIKEEEIFTKIHPSSNYKDVTTVFETAYHAIYYMMQVNPNQSQSEFRQSVEFVLNNKFLQHPECMQRLLETGFRQLQCLYGPVNGTFPMNGSCIGTIYIKLRNIYYNQL